MTIKFSAPSDKKVMELAMDAENPRIPKDKRALGQDGLVLYVADKYNSLAIARSISSHQYFPSEPLIAAEEKGSLVVVEGNRRLAALKLLLTPELRAKMSNSAEWDKLAGGEVPDEVPVMVVRNRREVAPLIGYRHISGIEPWDPYSKSRYVAAQLKDGLDFKQIAIEVGESESQVKSHYRNYQISEEISKSGADPEAIEGMRENFGVFTRAMENSSIRDFIGAPAANQVSKTKSPIPASKKAALKELVGLMFGPGSVLGESREITKFGKVISSKDGLDSLRSDRNLETAYAVSGGVRDRLVNWLSSAGKSLRSAKGDMPKHAKDTEVHGLIDECKEAVQELEVMKK